MNAGQLQVACTNLTVSGTLDTGTGAVDHVMILTVGASGVISGSGTIHYVYLSNSGSIAPTVNLIQHRLCGSAELVSAQPVPAVGTWMLIALAAMLLGLAGLKLRRAL